MFSFPHSEFPFWLWFDETSANMEDVIDVGEKIFSESLVNNNSHGIINTPKEKM